MLVLISVLGALMLVWKVFSTSIFNLTHTSFESLQYCFGNLDNFLITNHSQWEGDGSTDSPYFNL